MEALAAGVPLAVRDLPVFREVFGDVARFAADAAELAELLALAITEPDQRRTDGGRMLAASYPWSAAASAHLRLYREVC